MINKTNLYEGAFQLKTNLGKYLTTKWTKRLNQINERAIYGVARSELSEKRIQEVMCVVILRYFGTSPEFFGDTRV